MKTRFVHLWDDLVFASLKTDYSEIARTACEWHYKCFDIWTPLVWNSKHSLASSRLLPSLHLFLPLQESSNQICKYFPAVFRFIKLQTKCVTKIMGHSSVTQNPFRSIVTSIRHLLQSLHQGGNVVYTKNGYTILEMWHTQQMHT
jgi:hypothetical protein